MIFQQEKVRPYSFIRIDLGDEIVPMPADSGLDLRVMNNMEDFEIDEIISEIVRKPVWRYQVRLLSVPRSWFVDRQPAILSPRLLVFESGDLGDHDPIFAPPPRSLREFWSTVKACAWYSWREATGSLRRPWLTRMELYGMRLHEPMETPAFHHHVTYNDRGDLIYSVERVQMTMTNWRRP